MTPSPSVRSAGYIRALRANFQGRPQGGWQPQEKISLANCIRAYTSGSAYGEFMEGKKGELNVGEFADIERPHER
jgi:predicted amidohydrolase YtcJ